MKHGAFCSYLVFYFLTCAMFQSVTQRLNRENFKCSYLDYFFFDRFFRFFNIFQNLRIQRRGHALKSTFKSCFFRFLSFSPFLSIFIDFIDICRVFSTYGDICRFNSILSLVQVQSILVNLVCCNFKSIFVYFWVTLLDFYRIQSLFLDFDFFHD